MVTVLSIDEKTANLDRVELLDATPWPKDTDNCTVIATSLMVERVSVISLSQSNLNITQSRFEGNRLSNYYDSRIIYDKYGSNITIT